VDTFLTSDLFAPIDDFDTPDVPENCTEYVAFLSCFNLPKFVVL
jgi:hypothetical protein